MDHVQFLKHFLHVNIKLLQHQLLIIFFSTFAFVPLLEISCPYMYGSISGVSILSIFLFIYNSTFYIKVMLPYFVKQMRSC